MGLCRRAGALVIGMDAQLAAMRRERHRLVLAQDASPATARRAGPAAAAAGIPTVVSG